MYEFRKCVDRYQGNHQVKSFSCFNQYLCMAFAQLTYREGLRDIEACLRSRREKLYHLGIRGHVSRSTLADANEHRDWRVYADLARVVFEPGAFYVMDRAYVHFERLFRLNQTGAFFVTRAEKKTQYRRQYSRPVDRSIGLRADQTIRLTGETTQHTYPAALRCVRYYDAANDKRFTFLTNNFLLPAFTIAKCVNSALRLDSISGSKISSKANFAVALLASVNTGNLFFR